MVDIQGIKFPGYGRCIYCGSTGPLKDEHIIPLSLGGKAVIEAASCGDCEKVTSYLDGYLARQIFHEPRSHRHEITPPKAAADRVGGYDRRG
jgi:5-methylcytosine-specific restriction endonuclease McrA